ncbi:MAG: PKD domain-containing protein [Sphingobacteriales bacterium]|nr:MAG: PKD domain-containing protein [Sphingobacteriales bacterium]
MKFILTGVFFLLTAFSSFAQQYTVNGDALKETCNCYRLTRNQQNQSGSVWNNIRIDLNNSFDYNFDVYLGTSNSPGADGIAFVLQPISTSVGSTGGGMGFQGITPSIGVTLDTYQNGGDGDPVSDHIAIQRNGDLIHSSVNNLAGPVQASSTNANIEDGVTHKLRVVWNATTKTLTTYFDGIQRLSVNNDFVNSTFGGNSLVFWGFTGATGGEWNEQRFCTALSPIWKFSTTQKRCLGEPIQFVNASISFTNIIKMYWDFGDGSNIDSVNANPIHTYALPGNYTVKQKVIGADGCEATNEQMVIVGSKPVANFTISDSCVNNNIQFNNTSTATFGTINNWYWELDGLGITSGVQNPSLAYSTPGVKNIRLAVKSLQGCESDTIPVSIRVYGRPVMGFTFTDSLCLGSTYVFNGTGVSPDGLPVHTWGWLVDGVTPLNNNSATVSHLFTTAGNHTLRLIGTTTGTNTCLSAPVTKSIFVVDKPRAAIKVFKGCEDVPVTLQDSSYTLDGLPVTSWWWDLGNGQFSSQQNPTTIYTVADSVTVKLVVFNSKGCKSDTLIARINVSSKPTAKFGRSEGLCNNSSIRFSDSSFTADGAISQWEWASGGTVFSTQQNPAYTFPVGLNTVSLSVVSSEGCKSDPVSQAFNIKAKPVITMSFKDTCKMSEAKFSASETSSIGITSWHWQFGDGNVATGNTAAHIYTINNRYTIKLHAISVEGCSSDTIEAPINIYGTDAFAGNDIIAAASQPVQLNATGGLSYAWTPSAGLTASDISNPVATNVTDRTYYLRAFTPEGCESYDTINIKIYKGPDIYVPTAFTPNGDGRNDVLKPITVGITVFDYFAVYNRLGQLVFKSNDSNKGWDGRVKGLEQQTGNFVWMVSGTDFRGNKIFKKGSVLLIR